MDALSYKTKFVNKAASEKDWLLVDAENEVVGRLASKIAYMIRGKHKTNYTPHTDCGYNIVVINAERVDVPPDKKYYQVYKAPMDFVGSFYAHQLHFAEVVFKYLSPVFLRRLLAH